jgi:RNA polymerase sigma-B factor
MSTEPRHASTRTRTPDRTTGGRFQRHRTRNDPRVRDELFARHLGLARHLARRYQGSGESPDDLLQIASIGLIKAIDRFDPDRGPGFASFAVPYILGELRRHFRDRGWTMHVPRGVQENYLRINEEIERQTAHRGRAPSTGELALATGLSAEDVAEAIDAGRTYSLAPLDAPHPAAGADARTLGETIATTERRYEYVEIGASLAPAFRRLPEREQAIVRLRFFEDLTQSEIADRVGVSQMHVSRLLRRALDRLRPHVDGEPST